MTKKFIEFKHPVLKHKLGYLRDKETTSQVFRSTLRVKLSILRNN